MNLDWEVHKGALLLLEILFSQFILSTAFLKNVKQKLSKEQLNPVDIIAQNPLCIAFFSNKWYLN